MIPHADTCPKPEPQYSGLLDAIKPDQFVGDSLLLFQTLSERHEPLELRAICQYVTRWTVNWSNGKAASVLLSEDEFCHGRWNERRTRTNPGTRWDGGLGISADTLRKYLALAVKRGYLVIVAGVTDPLDRRAYALAAAYDVRSAALSETTLNSRQVSEQPETYLNSRQVSAKPPEILGTPSLNSRQVSSNQGESAASLEAAPAHSERPAIENSNRELIHIENSTPGGVLLEKANAWESQASTEETELQRLTATLEALIARYNASTDGHEKAQLKEQMSGPLSVLRQLKKKQGASAVAVSGSQAGALASDEKQPSVIPVANVRALAIAQSRQALEVLTGLQRTQTHRYDGHSDAWWNAVWCAAEAFLDGNADELLTPDRIAEAEPLRRVGVRA